ncbi:MAG: helix-turn-helix transcriptional regulator [Elusimicrobiota bacterium]
MADPFKEAFPGAKGDPYDLLIPPTTFGGWLKNLRMRRGLKLKDLARSLKVRPFTVIRYEADVSRPDRTILKRLRLAFTLDNVPERFP